MRRLFGSSAVGADWCWPDRECDVPPVNGSMEPGSRGGPRMALLVRSRFAGARGDVLTKLACVAVTLAALAALVASPASADTVHCGDIVRQDVSLDADLNCE